MLLWGYLPKYAGWYGWIFLIWQCASVRGGGLFPHDSSSWKGSDTASIYYLVPSVHLFLSLSCVTKDWEMSYQNDCDSHFLGVGNRGNQQASHPGERFKEQCCLFLFVCLFLVGLFANYYLTPMENFKRLIRGSLRLFRPGIWSGNASLCSRLISSHMQRDYPQWNKCHYWGRKNLNCLPQSNSRNEE